MAHPAHHDNKAIALPALGKVLDVLGLGAGVAAVVDPSGTAGIVSASVPVVRTVISHLEGRDAEHRAERARLLLENLRERVAQLEQEQESEPPFNLFEELLSNAIAQDDDRKVPLQGAVIAWVSSRRPDPALARLAMSAVANLGYPELRAFITWDVMGNGRLRLERGWTEGATWARLHHAGLMSQTGTVGKQFITPVGRMLIDGCTHLAYSEQEASKLQ